MHRFTSSGPFPQGRPAPPSPQAPPVQRPRPVTGSTTAARLAQATTPDVSVIVPCRGDVTAALAEQLDALAGQDFTGEWELVIADHGVRDDLPALLARYVGRLPRARIVATGRPERGHAINRAIAESRASRLILLDSDGVVTPSYLRETVAALQRHDFVGTRLDSVTLNPGWLRARRRPLQEVQLDHLLGRRPAVIGAGMALTRAAFDQVAGFDDDLLVLEDLDISFRLQQLRVRPFFASAAVVRYRYRQTWFGLLEQERINAEGEARLYLKHRGELPRRRLRHTARGWLAVIDALPRVPTRAGRARLATALGAAIGRAQGSLRYRVLHL